MKLTIDETNKKITVEEPVNLHEFIQYLHFRNIHVEEYILDVNNTITYIPYYPWIYPQYPTITYTAAGTTECAAPSIVSIT